MGTCKARSAQEQALRVDLNLIRRVAAALVLAPAVLAAVLWLPTGYFAACAALFVTAGSWEWAGLSEWSSPPRRSAYALATLVLLAVLFVCARGSPVLLAACAAGAVWWGAALLWVLSAQRGGQVAALRAPWLHRLCGWLTLVPAWSAVVFLHALGPHGRWQVVLLLILVWSADTGAYFVGRRFGRRRLASRLSPGKSLEGVLGGVAACLVIGIAVTLGTGEADVPPWVLPVLCVGVALICVLGDLTESLLKRQAGAKDSGALIPGHGGVLDRIDSLCAAAPCFALSVVALFGG